MSMQYEDLVKPAIRTQPVYQPGKPVEVLAREIGIDPSAIAKLASNENPLGSSPMGIAAAGEALADARLYPENSAFYLKQRLAAKYGLQPEQFSVTAGSNELLYLMGDLFMAPGSEIVMGAHAFVTAKIVGLLYGAKVVEVPHKADLSHDLEAMRAAVTERTRIVYLPDPNNPTGTSCTEEEVTEFVRSLPDHVIFIYDEAYAEFRKNAPDLRPLIAEGRKVLCMRTFSKLYGLAGLRVGYGYSDPELASLINRVRPPFNVSVPALAAALAALDDHEWVATSRKANREGMAQLCKGLEAQGLAFIPSEANFVLVRIDNADVVFEQLERKGLIVRPVKGYGLPDYLRFSIGTPEQNERLLVALRDLCAEGVCAPSAGR